MDKDTSEFIYNGCCSPMHPGMNAYVERLNGTIRREALKTNYWYSLRRNQKYYPGSEYDENTLCQQGFF